MSGIQLTGDLETTGADLSLSGLEFTITYVLPNPKGSDRFEEVGVFVGYKSEQILHHYVVPLLSQGGQKEENGFLLSQE